MLNNENAMTINFLSRECKDYKHESCVNKWNGLGFNFDCDCNCHKLNIRNSGDSDPNTRIKEHVSLFALQSDEYNTRMKKDNLGYINNIKIPKNQYSNCNTDEKGSSKLSFSSVSLSVSQHAIKPEADLIHV
jgi:hypothetical protein